MRWLLRFAVLLVVAGCSGGKPAVKRQLKAQTVSADSFRSFVADDLQVRLHEVVVLPVDSPRVRMEIKEVELKRGLRAEAAGVRRDSVIVERTDEQIPATPKSSRTIFWIALGCALVLAYKLSRRSGC